MSPCWIEIVAWVIGALTAVLVLLNPKAQGAGIGDHTTRALTICLGVPLLLTLAMQKLLEPQTVAAIVAALLGIGIQKDK